jgi:uncharacterized Zn-finger protein
MLIRQGIGNRKTEHSWQFLLRMQEQVGMPISLIVVEEKLNCREAFSSRKSHPRCYLRLHTHERNALMA